MSSLLDFVGLLLTIIDGKWKLFIYKSKFFVGGAKESYLILKN
jgi:hypothetical protein